MWAICALTAVLAAVMLTRLTLPQGEDLDPLDIVQV